MSSEVMMDSMDAALLFPDLIAYIVLDDLLKFGKGRFDQVMVIREQGFKVILKVLSFREWDICWELLKEIRLDQGFSEIFAVQLDFRGF
jgi:hypothetical protein